MGLFKKKPNDPSEIEQLKGQIASMAARLDATDAVEQLRRDQVQGDTTRLTTAPEPPPPPSPPEPQVDPEAFESVSEQVHAVAERIGEFDTVVAQVDSIAGRLDQLDARITSISNELANQITELSSDLEGLTGNQPAADLVDQLRDTQVNLANEQARYQIAFRQDLAHLADFLKHT